MWVGDYSDVNFGKLSAETYTQVAISSPGITAPTDAVYDSLTFTFKYGDVKYGDTTKPFTLNLYKLTKTINSDSTYYSTSSLPYESTPIGSATFSPSKFSKQRIDSVSMRLSDALGQELFSKFGSTDFSSSDNFKSYFKGLRLASDGNNSAIIGGSLTSDTTNTYRLSRIILHYHIISKPTEAKRFHFPIYPSVKNFTKYSGNRSGSPIASIANTNDSIISSNASSNGYIQSGSGLAVKIAFPHIKALKEKLGNIAINRAELIISATNDKDIYTNQAPILVLYQAKSNGQLLKNSSDALLPVQTDGNSIVGTSNIQYLGFNYTTKQYSVVLTDYIQALLYDKSSQYFLIKSATTAAGNIVVGDQNHPTKPIKLKIYYSKIQ
jgi:hypothetical protein